MDHKTALNMMLAHACPMNESNDFDDNVNQYSFDVHCVTFIVTAKLTGMVEDEGKFEFDILDIKYED